MIKVYIENVEDESGAWVFLPNGDIDTAISDIVGDNDWEVAMLVSKTLWKNSFIECDIIELNKLLLELEEDYHFDVNDVSNLSVLNMLLKDRHYNIEEVRGVMVNESYHIYNIESVEELAK